MTTMSDEPGMYILPDERQPPPGLSIGEAALGGMIPTSICIILLALVRIIRMMQERRRRDSV